MQTTPLLYVMGIEWIQSRKIRNISIYTDKIRPWGQCVAVGVTDRTVNSAQGRNNYIRYTYGKEKE